MASGGKKKTTMAKLTRESKLRERRADKQARKDARKHAAANPDLYPEITVEDDEAVDAEAAEAAGANTASI
jgi:hypothetical protein